MQKFFTMPIPNGFQLPVAVIIRPLQNSNSTGKLVCTGTLVHPRNQDSDPIFKELIKRFEVNNSELVVQVVSQFKHNQDTYMLWPTTHASIQGQNPKLACASTQVFFLFGNSENSTDLNSTQQFIRQTFQNTETFLIDYSNDKPQLIHTNDAFNAKNIHPVYTNNPDSFFHAFFDIMENLKQPNPANQIQPSYSESSCIIV